jgi:glycosyltransferase involved in cell wall biosynthesis
VKNLLLISYLFPPAGGISVQRALSFATYLPDLGVKVHVMSARNAASPVNDPGLLERLPASVTRHYAFTPELSFQTQRKLWALLGLQKAASTAAPALKAKNAGSGGKGLGKWISKMARTLLSPDPQILWLPFVTRSASRIIRNHNIDTVMITAPPFSALKAGVTLKRRFPHIRLVSDFRDDWIGWYIQQFDFLKNDSIRKCSETIERAVVEASDIVLVVTRMMLDSYRSRYPDQPAAKFVHIDNGYDPAAVKALPPSVRVGNTIRVTHVGTVYLASSPRHYFQALDSLPPELRSRFETRYVGRIAESEAAYFEDRPHVQRLGFLPQQEALREMQHCDFLLVTMVDALCSTGKLFEYLGSGRPILAISPRGGEVERLILDTKAGLCAPPDEPEAIRAMLVEAARRLDSGGKVTEPDWDVIRRYERPRLVEELAKVLG